jgi:hypothetical protein
MRSMFQRLVFVVLEPPLVTPPAPQGRGDEALARHRAAIRSFPRKDSFEKRDCILGGHRNRLLSPNKLFYTFQLPILARRCSAVKQNAVLFFDDSARLALQEKIRNPSITVTYNNRFFFFSFRYLF